MATLTIAPITVTDPADLTIIQALYATNGNPTPNATQIAAIERAAIIAKWKAAVTDAKRKATVIADPNVT